MIRIFIAILTVFILLPELFGQDPEKKQYNATQITATPVINGILDDETWESGDLGWRFYSISAT